MATATWKVSSLIFQRMAARLNVSINSLDHDMHCMVDAGEDVALEVREEEVCMDDADDNEMDTKKTDWS
jgi:hypothetical protein